MNTRPNPDVKWVICNTFPNFHNLMTYWPNFMELYRSNFKMFKICATLKKISRHSIYRTCPFWVWRNFYSNPISSLTVPLWKYDTLKGSPVVMHTWNFFKCSRQVPENITYYPAFAFMTYFNSVKDQKLINRFFSVSFEVRFDLITPNERSMTCCTIFKDRFLYFDSVQRIRAFEMC